MVITLDITTIRRIEALNRASVAASWDIDKVNTARLKAGAGVVPGWAAAFNRAWAFPLCTINDAVAAAFEEAGVDDGMGSIPRCASSSDALLIDIRRARG